MAIKELEVENIGLIRFQKRRGTRSIRIHIQGHTVQVTMPHWITYHDAIKFVMSRQQWIEENRIEKPILSDGALIGKAFELKVTSAEIDKPKTRVLTNVIMVQLPRDWAVENDKSQNIIQRTCERALAKEAKELLTPRIHDLAYEHDIEYKSLHFKKLKRRWGSCDHQKNIVLNIFLTQLPWDYIDYVLLHELTHTEHLHHGTDFWSRLTELKPDAKRVRSEMKAFHPQLLPH